MNSTNPPVHITTGAYILNEGMFSPNTSGLSFYSIITDSIYNNIFAPGNLGLFPDGLALFGDNIFITEQGNFGSAGKIYKCDTTGKVISSQAVGKNPYSLCISNNKIYVTNGPASNVSVVDINTLTTNKSINVGVYPQEILSFGNYVYVCNTSLYGGASDSTISVIDVNTDLLLKTIFVHKDPSSIVKSRNNNIIVGCPGTLNGAIFIIDPTTNTKIDSIIGIDFGKDISVDYNSDNIYFISNSNSIVNINLSLKTINTVVYNPNPGSVFFNGYTYDYKNNQHYVLNARNFTTNGILYIFDLYGTLIQSFQVGFVPRRIVINSK
jgi:YVTN family beta-propeller protein